jgi:hypothetical protein
MTTWHALIAAAALCPLAGCATHDHNTNTPRPGSGLEEYRQLTGEATAGVLSALSWLERVSAQPGRCPPKIVSGFAHEVEQLQVKSIRVRARGQAIRARGDAYFEAWTGGGEQLSVVPPRPTPERLAQLRENFTKIKLASQEAGETFRPFFNGLRNLRAELEADPGVIENEKARELIRTTRERGLQVLQKLGALEDELHAMRPLMTQQKPVTKH